MEKQLLLGDCLERLKELPDNSVDSIVTDAPYGLSFMGKKWDYDVPSVDIWKECFRVLKPGGHLLCFGGSRTYHRLAVNVEDAGFEIRDQIQWIYGSGFPKSHNIGKALDKNNGNGDLVYEVAEKLKEARESRGITKTQADKLFCNGSTNYSWLEGRKDGVRLPEDELFQTIVNEWPELKPYQEKVKSANREIVGKYDSDMGGLGGERLGSKGGDITLPATPIAKQYEGWGTALKPAHEPIVMARKPFKGSVAQNVLKHGTGGINIDESRILGETRTIPIHSDDPKNDETMFGLHATIQHERVETNEGRFPANIILSEEAAENLDQHTGISKSGYNPNADKKQYGGGVFGGGVTNNNSGYTDKGGASRYFYVVKPSKKEKEFGMSGEKQIIKGRDEGQDKRSVAYKVRPVGRKNIHPTVKPIKLMEYLIKLVTPVGGTTLDPFMGSGTTGIAALTNGFNFIGIEMCEEYMDIAQQRIEAWTKDHQTKLDI